MEDNACSVTLALIKLDWGPLVHTVPLTRYLQLAAPRTPPVNVTLGTQGKMGAHAHRVVSTNTRKNWGLLLAQIVHQIHHLQLAASQTLHVNVRLGTRE